MSTTGLPSSLPEHRSEPHRHVVQFYGEEDFLLDELRHFIGSALAAGDSAVVVATKWHRNSLAERLKNQGLDLAKIATEGRFVALDASETLSKFMMEGRPDPTRFSEILGGTIAKAAAAAHSHHRPIAVFGEMVALLWAEGNSEGAIQLEKLWNELAKSHPISLRCAYPILGFCREEHAESLLRICAEHSGVVPDASQTKLTSEDERLRGAVRLQQQAQVLQSEIDWHRREEQFRLSTETQDYAVIMLDAEGRVRTWNAGAERISRYKTPELVGRDFSCFYSEEDVLSGKPQELLKTAIQDGRSEYEGWQLRKDGSKAWTNVSVTAVRNEAGELIGFGKIIRDITEHKRAELALRRSEDRFRMFVEAVQDYAIFMLDPEGYVRTWNAGAERIKGYKTPEIIGQHFSCFYIEEDLRTGKPRRELEVAAKVGRFEDEGWRRRKDGSLFWANVIITAVRDEMGKLIGFGKVTRDFTERMRTERSLRDLSLHLLKTQDEERRRLGRDLHDSLGQWLTVIKMSLDSLSLGFGDKDQASEKVAQCIHYAEECIREVRTISYLLYPPMLEELGLKSAIPWYLEGFTKRSGIQTTSDISPDFARLPRDTELALFRVLQESLTNVHRHSGSPIAHVRLATNDGITVLEVSDQGKGLGSPNLEESEKKDLLGPVGVGLRGMKERMQQLGGKLEISSTNGTRVTATISAVEMVELVSESA